MGAAGRVEAVVVDNIGAAADNTAVVAADNTVVGLVRERTLLLLSHTLVAEQ